jgi:hypothetical protein
VIGSRPWHSGGRDPGAEDAGGHDGGVRNRMRSVTRRMIAIGYAVRHIKERKGEREYRQLLRLTRQVLNDTGRVMRELKALPTRRQ